MVVAAGLILPGAVTGRGQAGAASPPWLCLCLPAPGYSRRGNCPSLPGVGRGLDWTPSPSLAGAELRRMDRSVQAGGRTTGSPVIPGKVTWTCPPHAETTLGDGEMRVDFADASARTLVATTTVSVPRGCPRFPRRGHPRQLPPDHGSVQNGLLRHRCPHGQPRRLTSCPQPCQYLRDGWPGNPGTAGKAPFALSPRPSQLAPCYGS